MICAAMVKGHLVLDENVSVLREELQKRNFRVISVPPGTPDSSIIEHLLPGRIIVTNNLADFEQDAEAFEFGIIYVTQTATADPSKAAKRISDAYSKYGLRHRDPFVLVVGVGETNKENQPMDSKPRPLCRLFAIDWPRSLVAKLATVMKPNIDDHAWEFLSLTSTTHL